MPFGGRARMPVAGHGARRPSWRAQAARATIFALLIGGGVASLSGGQTSPASPQAVLDQYCITCHNQKLRTAGMMLDAVVVTRPAANAEVWERVIAKLRAGSMPPPGRPRPDAATYDAVAGWLETEIDRAWIANPNLGRISAVHRLNRTEYGNAVRDLFALDPLSFDVKSLLPGDETAHGRPAASSYAGDGEPGFAGDDSWEKYMQIGGDAGLEVRVPVGAGPHLVGVSFVRELWAPEGLPQPLQRGRVITDDQVYMGYASVGSVQIGGPYRDDARLKG